MVDWNIWVGAHPRSIVVKEDLALLRFSQVEFLSQGFGSGRVSSTVRTHRSSAFEKIGRVRAAREARSFGVDVGGARLGIAALAAD